MEMQAIETAGAKPANPSCTVERKPLLAALDFLCRRLVERRNTIPILSNVLIGPGDDGGLRLYATDLDMTAELDLPAVWWAPGRFTVAAAALRDALKKADGATVELSWTPGESRGGYGIAYSGRLLMKSGRSRVTLPTLPPDDMPVIAPLSMENGGAAFTLPAGRFARDLGAVAPAMSSEVTRYYLNGAALQVRDGRLHLVATDGAQLAAVERDAPAGAEAMPDVIIPRRAVAAILARIAKAGDTPLSVETDGSKMAIAGEGWRIATKLVDGTFPDWRAVLPGGEASPFGEAGLQRLAMVELEPRIHAAQVSALAKAAGIAPIVETGEAAALITSPDYPEWRALSVFLREGASPKGTGPNDYEHAGAPVIAYARQLAERRGLPAFAEASAQGSDGLYRGVTFGKAEYLPGGKVEVLDWETLTVREEWRDGETVYEDGAYSIPIPRSHQSLVTLETIGADGEPDSFRHVPTNARGAIALSGEAVAALCGPVEDMARVEIPGLTFHHGRIIAIDHIAVDGTGRRVLLPGPAMIPGGKGKRSRKRSDREAIAAYCRDPAGELAALQPRYYAEPDAAGATQAPAEADPAHVGTPEPAEVVSPASEPLSKPAEPAEAAWARMRARGREWAATPPTVETEPTPRSMERPSRTPARERLIRRYLGMRAERERLRDRLERAVGQVHDAEGRAERGWDAQGEAARHLCRMTINRKRTLRRAAAMRDRLRIADAALAAAREHLAEVEAAPAAPPIVHQDQEPGYPAIARLHDERAEHRAAEAASAERIRRLEAANAMLAAEVEKLAGRAIRAERALMVHRTPGLVFAPAYGNAARVSYEVGA